MWYILYALSRSTTSHPRATRERFLKIFSNFRCGTLLSAHIFCFRRLFIKEQLKNEQIVGIEVRLIGSDGSQLGIVSAEHANKLAEEEGLDLVMIAPDGKPPVCKIMDYGKFKFDSLKKIKDQKKNQKVIKLKEMQLSMTIGDNDLQIKSKAVRKFLENGDKVRVYIRMRGRMQAKPQIGVEVMNKFAEMVADVGAIDKAPEVQGRMISLFLVPIKK